MGEGSRRGIEMVALEALVAEGVRMGRPAREAWMVEVALSRCVPGPRVYVPEGPRGRPG